MLLSAYMIYFHYNSLLLSARQGHAFTKSSRHLWHNEVTSRASRLYQSYLPLLSSHLHDGSDDIFVCVETPFGCVLKIMPSCFRLTLLHEGFDELLNLNLDATRNTDNDME